MSEDSNITLRELQQIELAMLKDIAKFCRLNNITFFLGEGTMLGAVRHNGFIPWDDDIDILVPRSQYQYFLTQAIEQLDSKYEVQHSSTVKNYWSPFIKIRLIEGDLRFSQTHIQHLTNHNGPLIDVFPIDEVPAKYSLSVVIQSCFIRAYRGMITLKLRTREPKTILQQILVLISRLYSIDGLHKRLDKWFNKYSGVECKYAALLSTYHPIRSQIVLKECFSSALEVSFEGEMMPIPIGYHEVLCTEYGDYMTLPPLEEQVNKHHFD